ncbi:MAG: hypothetical protein V2A78_12880 [bacterium]
MDKLSNSLGIMSTHNVIIEDFLSTRFPRGEHSPNGFDEDEFMRVSEEARRGRLRELEIFCRVDSGRENLLTYVRRQLEQDHGKKKRWLF